VNAGSATVKPHSLPFPDNAMTTRRLISSGSRFEEEIGYSRAVVDGDMIFVSGTTGYDYTTMTIVEDVIGQADQAFRNIAAALAQAEASLDDVVRVLFIVPRREDWEPCWPIIKMHLGRARPASTLIHAGLQTDAMRIEIEVIAKRQDA
jgi:enamine deaminase RidA (YjgF/YER057c/UK114 family)